MLNCFIRVFAAALLVHGVTDVSVSVMEGDSLTLHNIVKINPQDTFTWYFHDMRIAYIYNNVARTCTDNECEEKFKDRLKMDNYTGSLTITNISTTDEGHYKLRINSNNYKSIDVAVHKVSERNEVVTIVKWEGQSVTLDPSSVGKIESSLQLKLYFNATLIAEINGNLRYTGRYILYNERFRDRLKVDNQTGSLTITNARTEDSGEYTLEIIISKSNSYSITTVKKFKVEVSDYIALTVGIVLAVSLLFLLAVAIVGIMYLHRYKKGKSRNDGERPRLDESNDQREPEPDQIEDQILIDSERPRLDESDDQREPEPDQIEDQIELLSSVSTDHGTSKKSSRH